MVSDNWLTLATSAAGLGITGLLSAPGGVHLIRRRLPKRENEVYEDKDGKSTPEAVKAFSTKVPKAIILILAVAGLGLSITLAALTVLSAAGSGNAFSVENWLGVGAWVSQSRTSLSLRWTQR